jgi:hypothetical protein
LGGIQIDAIRNAAYDDLADKVILYLEEEKQHMRKSRISMTIIAITGAMGSLIAAITGVILLMQ